MAIIVWLQSGENVVALIFLILPEKIVTEANEHGERWQHNVTDNMSEKQEALKQRDAR